LFALAIFFVSVAHPDLVLFPRLLSFVADSFFLPAATFALDRFVWPAGFMPFRRHIWASFLIGLLRVLACLFFPWETSPTFHWRFFFCFFLREILSGVRSCGFFPAKCLTPKGGIPGRSFFVATSSQLPLSAALSIGLVVGPINGTMLRTYQYTG